MIERHNSITQAKFQRNNAKLYFPVVTLYINDNIEFLENIKEGFKRKVHWNKYISKIIIQTKNNDLDYLIDSTLRNVNRLYVISFKNDIDYPTRYSFNKYYILLVKIKDFNALINSKTFSDQ